MIKDFFSGPRMTEDELNARLKFFIGIILGLTLFGIVFVVLYSLIFVTQPMNGMSPVDNKFFELIIPIATFLTGTLSGIMLAGGNKEAQMKALEAATRPTGPSSPSPAPVVAPRIAPTMGMPLGGNTMSTAPFTPPVPAATTPFATAAPAPVAMSSSGKPMPVLPPDEEL